MAKVTFITEDGKQTTVENAIGNLMEIAREHDIEGHRGCLQWVLFLCNLSHIRVKPRMARQDRTGHGSRAGPN